MTLFQGKFIGEWLAKETIAFQGGKIMSKPPKIVLERAKLGQQGSFIH